MAIHFFQGTYAAAPPQIKIDNKWENTVRIIQCCVLWSFCAVYIPAGAAELTLVSTAKQAGLLELYSSEGCSSCPAADRWLSSLKRKPQLWNQIIPIVFHVDYWDYIGWTDRFAASEFTQRQYRYAQESAITAVYTPGFIYNGKEWRQWFKSRQLVFPTAKNSGVLRADVQDNRVTVSFRPSEEPAGKLVVNVALLGFDLKTTVRAGENKGSELRHDFVVLGFQQAKLANHDETYSATTALPATDKDAPQLGIAIWVSRSNRQGPLQAVGGWLDDAT